MKSLARHILLVAAVVIGGCSGPKIPPPSAFYSAVDLESIVKQCAPQDLKWGGYGSGSSGGGSPSSYHENKSFNGDFQAEEDSLDTFLQALKVELQKAVEAHGGRVVSSVILSKEDLPKAVARRGTKRTTKDGTPMKVAVLSGFQLNYEVGATPGEILVTLVRIEDSAAHPSYPLNLGVDIFESGPAGQQPLVPPKAGADR